MTKSYAELLHMKNDYEIKYYTLMCDYYDLQTEVLEKEISIARKKEINMMKKLYREYENELSILEHEFIFS